MPSGAPSVLGSASGVSTGASAGIASPISRSSVHRSGRGPMLDLPWLAGTIAGRFGHTPPAVLATPYVSAYPVRLRGTRMGIRGGMPGATETVERERKFEATERIEIPDIPGASVVSRSDVRLTATYWDTVQRRLLRWGHTLRHRRASDGSEDRWTLKLSVPSRKKDGELRRIEAHVPGGGLYPPPAIRALARAVLRRAVLAPIATIVTERHRVELADDASAERVELSDDRVSSVLGLRRGPAFRQIEVESVGSDGDGLTDEVASALVGAGAVPTDASKLATVLGNTPPPPEIEIPPKDADMSIRDVLRFAIGSGGSRLIENDPVARIGADPEAIHQARVATRRLRSDLKTLQSLLDGTTVEWLRDELRWVGELLGSVRDSDVMIGRVRELEDQLRLERGASRSIVAELEHDRHEGHAALVEALASRRYVVLIGELIAAASDPPLADGIDGDARARPTVRKLVRKDWRRVSRAVKELAADPDDAALHEIRKRAKRARYGAELAAAALGDDTDELAERLADVQDVLGDLQDSVVADERLTALVRSGRVEGMTAFAAGKLACAIGNMGSDARERWPAVWDAARAKRLRRALG
jgi:CHAD domain-containing protein